MSKQGGAPQAAAAPAAAQPAAPPQTVISGIQPPRRAIGPQLSPEPEGPDPVKELAQRQREAMAKHAGAHLAQEDAGAREGATRPPKAKMSEPTSKPSPQSSTASTPDSGSDTPGTAGARAAGSATEPAGGKIAEGEADEGEGKRGPRYDYKALKKYCEDHPDEAAALRKVFDLPADSNSEWIRIKNKQRRVREELHAERESTVSAAKAEREAAAAERAAMDGAATKLAPIADLWEAVAEKIAANPNAPDIDFEAADAAFMENAKVDIDTYMRLRARRNIQGGPEAARQRIENQKLRRQLAEKTQPAAEKVAEKAAESEAAAEKPGKQRTPQQDWSTELPPKHKLRQLDGWQLKLDDEMRKFYDPDTKDYDADPEEIADKVLKREIEAMASEFEEDEPAPPARGKRPAPAVPPKVAPKRAKVDSGGGFPDAASLTPKMTEPDDGSHPVLRKWEKRKDWALDRAMRAARGEQVEGYD